MTPRGAGPSNGYGRQGGTAASSGPPSTFRQMGSQRSTWHLAQTGASFPEGSQPSASGRDNQETPD